MIEEEKEYKKIIKHKENLEALLALTVDMVKQEELRKVNANTETTYGVLKKESIVQ